MAIPTNVVVVVGAAGTARYAGFLGLVVFSVGSNGWIARETVVLGDS